MRHGKAGAPLITGHLPVSSSLSFLGPQNMRCAWRALPLAELPALAGPPERPHACLPTRAGARHIGYPCYPADGTIKAESGNCCLISN